MGLTRIRRPLPPKEQLEGYLVDSQPRWELELDVLSHDGKAPFQPGRRTCYVADVQAVFDAQPHQVQGEYAFSFVWNVDVPGKPEFEAFHAKKKW